MQKIYLDPSHPGSFIGANKLYQAIKTEGKHVISLPKIKRWLHDKESYSLNKPIRRKFKRLKVIFTGMHNQNEADLADMQKFKDKNDGIQFLLVVIDVFTRYICVKPLKTKSEVDVMQGFKNNFLCIAKPRRLCTDRGRKFTGQNVQDYFDSINVEHWSAHNDEMKANYAKYII